MALVYLEKLPELSVPLDYPKCLDRIVQAAENRVNFEIARFKQIDLFMQQPVDWVMTQRFDLKIKPISALAGIDCTV